METEMETFICCLFLRVRRKQAGKGLGYGDREDGDRGLGSWPGLSRLPPALPPEKAGLGTAGADRQANTRQSTSLAVRELGKSLDFPGV